MHVFLTSAHGWIGSHITPLLLAKGHTITGLARSEASAEKLKAIGVTPLLLSLEQDQEIKAWVKSSDVGAVIHTAYNHDWSKYYEGVAMDLAVIKAIGEGLEGTNKIFINTSLPAAPTEDQGDIGRIPRGKSEETVLGFAEKGVQAIIIRLAPIVYGKGDQAFIPGIIGAARQNKASVYIEGTGIWSAVHVRDAAQLYIDVLEKGQAGKRYHAVQDSYIPVKDIAELVAKQVGVEAKAVSAEEAGQYVGFLAAFFQRDLHAESEITRKALGWAPKEKGLVETITNPANGYF